MTNDAGKKPSSLSFGLSPVAEAECADSPILQSMLDDTAKTEESALFASSLERLRQNLSGFERASLRLTSGDVQPDMLVSQLEIKLLLKANAAAMRAAEEMIGSLFDEKA